MRNWVITYESWDAYNAETEEEAISMFRKDHSATDEIVRIE
jgi:hypothetical protein